MASTPFHFPNWIRYLVIGCCFGLACARHDAHTASKSQLSIASGIPFGDADPFSNRAGIGGNILELVYPLLFRLDAAGEPLLDMAESIEWSQSSPEIKLRLKTPDADAVIATFEKIKKLSGIHFLEGMNQIREIKKISDRELVFVLEKWDRQLIYTLSLMPILESPTKPDDARFSLAKHSDEEWLLSRAGGPKDGIKTIQFLAIPSSRRAIRELTAGKLDFVLLANSGDLSVLSNIPDLETAELRASLFYMLLENHRDNRSTTEDWKPINRKVLATLFEQKPAEGLYDKPGYPFLDEVNSPDEAVSEKSESHSGLRKISFLGVQSRDRWLARMLKRSLETEGWQVELQSLSPADFQNRVFQNYDFDLALMPISIKDPIVSAYILFHTASGPQTINISGYSNPAFDSAIEAARFAKDPAVAKQNFAKALAILFEKPPGLFLGWATTPLVYRKGCTGFKTNLVEFFESLKDVRCVVSAKN